MQQDNPIDLTVDPRDLLPQIIKDELLPSEEGSVLYLFQTFNHYPPHLYQYILPSNFQSALHQDDVQDFNYKTLLTIGPPSSTILRAYQDGIKESPHPIYSITLRPCYSDPVRMPAWALVYWTEIGHVVCFQNQWKTALAWVQKQSVSPTAKELCNLILLGLSSISWSCISSYTCDIIPLFADSSRESYLTSFHIDHIVSQTKVQYEKIHGSDITSHHIFATVDHFNAITQFYGGVHARKQGSVWDNLLVIENSVIMGEVDSLGGVMHLPEHWVSAVIDFQQQQILYGDSLG